MVSPLNINDDLMGSSPSPILEGKKLLVFVERNAIDASSGSNVSVSSALI
jgi:hypothetical protein